jgi:hypothetical protein
MYAFSETIRSRMVGARQAKRRLRGSLVVVVSFGLVLSVAPAWSQLHGRDSAGGSRPSARIQMPSAQPSPQMMVATSDHQSQQPGANPVAAVSSEPADQPQSVDCGSLTQIEPLRGRPAGSHDQQPVSVGHAEAVRQSFSADSFGRSEPAGSFVGPFDSFGGAIQPLRQSESAADFVSVEPLARGLGAELD